MCYCIYNIYVLPTYLIIHGTHIGFTVLIRLFICYGGLFGGLFGGFFILVFSFSMILETACSLQDEVKFQQAETFVGDDLTIECPHIPRNTSSILVQQSKNVIGHQEVLLHCINFDSQDRRCIQQRLPVKYAYTQSRLSATFAESEFELIGNYSCQYYRDKVFVSQDIVHVDVYRK